MAADMAIKFLLLIDALKQTNRENPKTSKDLILEVESAWNDIFPDTPTKPLSESTIGRHIRDRAVPYRDVQKRQGGVLPSVVPL